MKEVLEDDDIDTEGSDKVVYKEDSRVSVDDKSVTKKNDTLCNEYMINILKEDESFETLSSMSG
jgi:hypothetical protein